MRLAGGAVVACPGRAGQHGAAGHLRAAPTGAALGGRHALAARWTTRIIVLPGAPLVRRGPYRLIAHPNYAVVVLEIAILPLVFGLVEVAAVFTLLNAAILAVRIRAENRALRWPLTVACAGLPDRPISASLSSTSSRRWGRAGVGPAARGFWIPEQVLTDTHCHRQADRTRRQGAGPRPGARGDDRRHVRSDFAGDGRAPRHAPADDRRLRRPVACHFRHSRSA